MMKVVDFFSGCGGTSWGFRQAGLEIALGLDMDANAAATFERNMPEASVLRADIRTLSPEILEDYVSKDEMLVFSGCAPCQPFSRQNRVGFRDDPRRTLLTEFARFVDHWRPEYVFVENVPGLQRVSQDEGPFSEFVALLQKHHYFVSVGLCPALWFGVPQTRERLILLAAKAGPISLPKATHGITGLPVATVRDWIGDLPRISAGEIHPSDPDHVSMRLSELNLARISATPEGKGRETWPEELWLECHRGHTGHSDVYGRLAWDRPASGLTTRCVSYSNGRFGHPDQNRAISAREAACLQTFPRTYRFEGGIEAKARQIGNAVPPLMAQRVGDVIIEHMKQHC